MRTWFLYLLTLLFCSCAHDHDADQIAFENIEKAHKLMVEQKAVLSKVQIQVNVQATSWEIKNGQLLLNGKELTEIAGDSSISGSFGLTKHDFEFLKTSSSELNRMGVCGAFKLGSPNIFAFLYHCEATGFDPKERFIILKEDIKSDQHLNSFMKVVLDENNTMILGY